MKVMNVSQYLVGKTSLCELESVVSTWMLKQIGVLNLCPGLNGLTRRQHRLGSSHSAVILGKF